MSERRSAGLSSARALRHSPAANREAVVEDVSMLLGVNIFVIVLVLLVILTIFAGVKTVPQGYHWTVERFGRYTAHAASRPQPDRAVLRSHRPQGQRDGAGDRHPAAGRHHQGQRHRHGRRRRVLPGVRRAEGELRGRRISTRRSSSSP